jgi:hypothetical protein
MVIQLIEYIENNGYVFSEQDINRERVSESPTYRRHLFLLYSVNIKGELSALHDTVLSRKFVWFQL